MQNSFGDAALVLLGHGTELNAESAQPVYQHAAELRRRGGFAEIREAFWKQEPRVTDVLGANKAARVFVVPLFLSEGYFSENVIPDALGFEKDASGARRRMRESGGQRWFYCRPLGTHPRMTEVVWASARAVVERFPFPHAPRPKETTLFIAGHGTEQDENSRRVVEEQVTRIRAQKDYAAVEAVFLEEEPRIPACYQMAPTRNIVLVPFFMSNGLHVREDIPVLLGEPKRIVEERLRAGTATWRNPTEKQGKLLWYASSVGTDPGLAEVILDRVREAAAS